MKAEIVRARIALAKELRNLADREEIEAKARLSYPLPGSIVRDVRSGILLKVYQEGGTLRVDDYATGGLRTPTLGDWLHYDVVQEPGFESDAARMKRLVTI